MDDFTGDKPAACPWRAFFDPFVQRVIAAHAFFESGQLEFYLHNPSHRLVEGLGYYHKAGLKVSAGLREMAAEARKRG